MKNSDRKIFLTLTIAFILLSLTAVVIPGMSVNVDGDPDSIEVSNADDLLRVGSGVTYGGKTWSLDANYIQTNDISLQSDSRVHWATLNITSLGQTGFRVEAYIDNSYTQYPDELLKVYQKSGADWVELVEDQSGYRLDPSSAFTLLIERESTGFWFTTTFSPSGGDMSLVFSGNMHPIGDMHNPFTGKYDGNGHVISGLEMEFEHDDPGSNHEFYHGLFAYLGPGASVLNLGLIDGTIAVTSGSGKIFVGSFAGSMSSSSMEDCYSDLYVLSNAQNNSEWCIGGLVGISSGSSNITRCFYAGYSNFANMPDNVLCKVYSGGIAGHNSAIISECYVNSHIKVTTGNRSDIDDTVSGVGGIAGYSDGKISDCYNAGNVHGTSYLGNVEYGIAVQSYFGGLVGRLDGAYISNCYTVASGMTFELVGQGVNATIVNCYTYGGLSLYDGTATVFTSGQLTNDLDDLSGVNTSPTTVNNTSIPGWDLENIWIIDVDGHNNGSPLLRTFLAPLPEIDPIGTGYFAATDSNGYRPSLSTLYSTFNGWIEAIPEADCSFGAWSDGLVETNRAFVLKHWKYSDLIAFFVYDNEYIEINNPSDLRKIGSGIIDAEGIWGLNSNYVQTRDIYFDYGDEVDEVTIIATGFGAGEGNNTVVRIEVLINGQAIVDDPNPEKNLKLVIDGTPYEIRNGVFQAELASNYGSTARIYRHSADSNIDLEIDLDASYGSRTEVTYSGSMYPIGGLNSPFTGSYSGDGHIISGLNICVSSDSNISNLISVGMFAALGEGAHVSNLGLKNGSIEIDSTSESLHVGNIAGYSEQATIYGCYNSNNISVVTEDGMVSIGGLIGIATYMNLHEGYIASCFNTGTINGTLYSGDVGGIVGGLNSLLYECYNTGAINVVDLNLPGSDGFSIGGISGYAYDATISNSYNTGSLKISSDMAAIGGISGRQYAFVINCYNIGAIEAPMAANAGNIVGVTDGDLFNCYYPDDTQYGLYGLDDSWTGSPMMYYEGAELPLNATGGSAARSAMTAAPSDTVFPYYAGETYYHWSGPMYIDGWDFGNIWLNDTRSYNDGYPILRTFLGIISTSVEPMDGGSVEGETEFYSVFNGFITAVPSSGYSFVGWNNGSTSNVLEFVIPHWTRDVGSFIANFSPVSGPVNQTYSIYAYSDEHSTIAPDMIRVRGGENATFNFEAAEGYSIVSVIIDGVDRSDLASTGIIEFNNVTDNHIISITSEPVEIWLTLNIKGNGTVNYSYQENMCEYTRPVLVDYGSTITLYAVAADRSVFKEWGSSPVDTTETSIVISNMTRSISIGVVFGAPDGSLDLSPEDEFTLFVIITAINVVIILALVALALKVGLSTAAFELSQMFGIKRTYKVTAMVIGAATGVAIVCAHRIERNGHCNFKIKKDGEFLVDEGLNPDPTRITDNYRVEYHMGDGEWTTLTDVDGEYMIPKVKGKIEIRLTYKGGPQ